MFQPLFVRPGAPRGSETVPKLKVPATLPARHAAPVPVQGAGTLGERLLVALKSHRASRVGGVASKVSWASLLTATLLVLDTMTE